MIAQRVIQEDLKCKEKNILDNKESTIFWSYVNQRLSKSYIIRNIRVEGNSLDNPEEIANAFNTYFTPEFSPKRDSVVDIAATLNTACSPEQRIESVTVVPEDISAVLKKIPPKKSNDRDGLSYKVLKEGGAPLAFQLCKLFACSLKAAKVPSAWKMSMVTPIHKSGPKDSLQNSRPISVTSCCSRVLESCKG